ncbi:MAG: hypothetical protein NTY01_03250 [Verrucomicrobia bacterium]|nr:hypothetical protein [Verrucomicrobiota bacterium]
MKQLTTLLLALALAAAATAADFGSALMLNSNGTVKAAAPASSNFWNVLLATLGSNVSSGGNSAPFTNAVNGSPTLLTVTVLNGGTGISFSVTTTNLSNWSADLCANYGMASLDQLGATQGSNVFAFSNLYSAIGATQGSNSLALTNLYGAIGATQGSNAITDGNLYAAIGSIFGSNQSALVSHINQVVAAGYLTGDSNFIVAGVNVTVSKTGATYYVSAAAAGGGLTLADVYGALGNLRPTNTVPPAITGSVTNGATIQINYGTFFSIRGWDFQTNQCWLWADDYITNGWGYFINTGTNASVTLPSCVSTGTVLYVGATVTNSFGMGSAIGAGVTVTNSVGGETHWRIKSTAGNLVTADGGLGYLAEDGLTGVGGSGTAFTITVTSVDEGDGHITGSTLLTAGDYTGKPSDPVSLSGGTGSGAKAQPTTDDEWETFAP